MSLKSFLPICFFALIACNSQDRPASSQPAGAPKQQNSVSRMAMDPERNSEPIEIDSANKMLSSYLTSIEYTHNDTDLRSLIINADSLRNYLNNTDIKYVKLMFAHTLEYINNGGGNTNAGYRAGALTLIIAGYSEKNNYIYNAQGRVYDNCLPCPVHCPTDGTASADLLPADH